MNNKKSGNTFESQFCLLLFDNGFWAHNMAQNVSGQPADVIAVKNGKAYLIDCKVCTASVFLLSRIEENQHSSMFLWEDSGNGAGWFALKIGDEIYMISYPVMNDMSYTRSVMNLQDIKKYGMTFENWVEKCK